MSKKILLTGATGMTGGLILDLCLASDQVGEVISLGRKETGKKSSKLKEILVPDFMDLSSLEGDFKSVDAAFYCIGVYTGTVPKEVFKKIMIDYPVVLGKALHVHAPNATFCLLSGAGADRSGKGRSMFGNTKGAAEKQLADIGFKAFHTFRPGYIYPVTKRKEPNLMYSFSRAIYPLIKLVGENASITSEQLAQGMFKVGLEGYGKEILENRDILGVL